MCRTGCESGAVSFWVTSRGEARTLARVGSCAMCCEPGTARAPVGGLDGASAKTPSGPESITSLLFAAPEGCVAMVRTRKPIELAARASKCTQVDRPSPETEEVKPQTRP